MITSELTRPEGLGLREPKAKQTQEPASQHEPSRQGKIIGAFVHVLLVIALVVFVAGLLSGRRSLA